MISKKLAIFLMTVLTATACSVQAMPNTHTVVKNEASATASTSRNLAQEEANKQLVIQFYDEVFNQHDLKTAPYKYLAEDLIQHNPAVPDGRKGFIERLTPIFEKSPQRRSRLIRASAEGDLVWTHMHSTEHPQDRGRAIMDIFRVKNGKIVEHWDVVQPIPEPEKAKNSNGMF